MSRTCARSGKRKAIVVGVRTDVPISVYQGSCLLYGTMYLSAYEEMLSVVKALIVPFMLQEKPDTSL
jgi:hypothetical protein